MAVIHPPPASFNRRSAQAVDAWSETRVATVLATRLATDKDDYLAGGVVEIGRRVSTDQHELFVVCDPAEALNQKLDHLRPEYIAIHDIGAAGSPSLLTAVAAALGGPVQRLTIRRQGFGTTLASLDFVELPAPRGRPSLRLYGTTCREAAADLQRQLAEVLLGHCRLGVLLVAGRDTPDAVERELSVLAEALSGVEARARQLLCVPLDARAATLLSHSALAGRADLRALFAPPCVGTAQVWAAVQDVWSQMRAGREPTLAAPAAPATNPAVPWQQRLNECAGFDALVSACVFDLASQRTLAHVGARPGPASLAAQGAALVEATLRAAAALGLPRPLLDLAFGCEHNVVLVRPIAGSPGLAVTAVLDTRTVDVEQVRRRLDRLGPSEAG